MPPADDTSGNCGYSGDGGPATGAQLNHPSKAVADSAGNVYIADLDNCVIRKVTADTGDISTYAGMSSVGNPSAGCGYSGDGGPATSAQLYNPSGLALDSSGDLYIADTNNCLIRKVTKSTGLISTYAGMASNTPSGCGYGGDGGPATSAQLDYPTDVALDTSGNLYIADIYNNRVRIVRPNGIIDTFAGVGPSGGYPGGYGGDGGLGTKAELYYPSSVAVDVAGDVLIADEGNQRVRWVDDAGIIYTVAGNGDYGFSGDGGAATAADFADPQGVGVDPSGNIYIADTVNDRIRKVTAFANLNSSAYSVTFPAQKVGTTSNPQRILLRAVGSLEIQGITLSRPGDFTQENRCPAKLTSGSSCEVNITFTPRSLGLKTRTLTIETTGFFNPTLTIKLTGTGQ